MPAWKAARPASAATDGEPRDSNLGRIASLARTKPQAEQAVLRPATAAAPTWPIASIRVGERHRRDLGDIDGLADSIKSIGLLQPVVVTPGGTLIAGARRIAAFKKLHRDTIPATIIDLQKVVVGEYAENTFRKDFTLSEAADIADEIEPIESAAAKDRQAATLKQGSRPGKLPTREAKGRALDKVAKVVGKGRRTIEKARAVRDAARQEPERFGKLQEDMDRTGRVDGPFKRLKVMRQAAEIRREKPPLPGNGPYRVIVADPPWPYEVRQEDPSHRATHPFPQMSIAQICAEKVGEIAHENCLLWLWTTNFHIREAFKVLDAWGFEHRTILTWAKDRMGTGDWLRGQTEHCLLAIKGRPIVELTTQSTLLHGPMRKNSQKPVEFYDFIEKLCPAPRYAELFSRYRHNDKWDCHGDEAPVVPDDLSIPAFLRRGGAS